ncbi:MAG: histidine kinase dimerization/phospho-acceptor domain-containing protein [Formivibrio sp.]|nr:histidine kinase dimerization/phospho-acceptor domain-containing protein [Formivibrio sp.]
MKTAQLLQQEKMVTIGQLAAGVAHEINIPMGFIIGNLSNFKKYTEAFNAYFLATDIVLADETSEMDHDNPPQIHGADPRTRCVSQNLWFPKP